MSATNSSTPLRATSPSSLPRSAVSTAVTPRSFNAAVRRKISWRICVASNWVKRPPSESIETRRAPTRSIACPIRAIRAPRSNSPVTIAGSPGWIEASTNAHRFAASHRPTSQPKPMRLRRMSSARSSKVTKTPDSPRASMLVARNCAAKTVLTLPAVPETKVVRPLGTPP